MRAREDAAGEAFPFADQSKQQVLGLNGDAAELAGLIAREEKNPSRPFCVAFEHPARLGLKGCDEYRVASSLVIIEQSSGVTNDPYPLSGSSG